MSNENTELNNALREQSSLRETLLKLVSAKEIRRPGGGFYTQAYIKKASEKTLEQIFQDYKREQLNKTNELFTDITIGKFSELLQHLNLIENATDLGRELADNEPFRQDIKFIVEYITPFIPLIGLFSGTLIVGKHIVNNVASTPNEKENNTQNLNNKEEECLNKESPRENATRVEKETVS